MKRNSVVAGLTAFLCLLIAGVATQASAAAKRTYRSRAHHHRYYYFDPAKYDAGTYDVAEVRELAIEALGHERGAVVAVDPSNGRILTIVDQKMAFQDGFEPCSTIKPVIALAGLEQGAITSSTMIKVGQRRYMDLTEALAHSNNKFFEVLGSRMGFDVVHRYAELVGLGQRVGYNIPQEQPGVLPSAPPAYGGVARMSSFGEGIRITPLQLAELVSGLANGGTFYYLQYPQTQEEIQNFTPRVRKQIDIAKYVPDIQAGMLAAVMYGTAHRSYDPAGEQALGKTGTCTDDHVGGRLGWFVSYADQIHPKIVIVVLLHGGGRLTNGPFASGIAGHIYRGLYQRNYFIEADANPTTAESTTGSGSLR
ncbi:MAG: penicillin-binding transpeptidase domain-containing protein [Candidatus Acidiferrales bacterium]